VSDMIQVSLAVCGVWCVGVCVCVCVCAVVAVPRSEGKTPLAAYSDILVVALHLVARVLVAQRYCRAAR